MGRAIFTQSDGVMGVDENTANTHQRRHAQRVAGVLRKGQEGRPVGNESAVQRKAVHHCRHGELAHAEVQVVSVTVVRGHGPRARVQGQIRAGQVGGAADEFGQQRRVAFEGILGGFA